MNSFRRSATAVGMWLALVVTSGCHKEPVIDYERRYQVASDSIRVKQLRDLADLIERFRSAKGFYPLTQGRPLPIEVAVSRQPPQGAPTNATAQELERDLSAGLGEAIVLPRDPQLDDLKGYRQYHYHSDGPTYAVWCHLYEATPLTERIDEVTHRFTLPPSHGTLPAIPAWTEEERASVRATDEQRRQRGAK